MPGRREGWRPRAATRSDSGMATAELAMALPALVAVVLVILWALGLAVGQALAAQAAREGARAAARGESPTVVAAAAAQVMPSAVTSTARSGGSVTVTVRVARHAPLRFLRPFDRTLTASATAWVESP